MVGAGSESFFLSNQDENPLNLTFGEIIVQAGLNGLLGHVWSPSLSLQIHAPSFTVHRAVVYKMGQKQ